MSEYSSELHSKLLEYKSIATHLVDKKIDRLEIRALSQLDNGNVTIRKIGGFVLSDIDQNHPTFLGDSAMIKITETRHSPDKFNGSIMKITDYVAYSDGGFSKPEQNMKLYSKNAIDNLNVRDELSKAIVNTKKKISKINNSKDQTRLQNLQLELTTAIGELAKEVEKERLLRSIAFEYDDYDHELLLSKLGSLVIVDVVKLWID